MARALIDRLAQQTANAAEKAVLAARATVLPIHPLQIDVLKLIACICMLIDHINTCLFDRASIWAYLIGRLAFPLFALTFVLTLKAHKAMATAKRLLIWAICTQPVYALAFANTGFSPWWAGNILFSFATVAYLVALLEAPSAKNTAKSLLVVAVASVIQAPSSFGAAGLLFMFALYHAMREEPQVAMICFALSAIAISMLNHTSFFDSAMLIACLVVLIECTTSLYPKKRSRLCSGNWSMWLYTGHICIISILVPCPRKALFFTN